MPVRELPGHPQLSGLHTPQVCSYLLEGFLAASYWFSSLIFKTWSWATAETSQNAGLSDVFTDPPE